MLRFALPLLAAACVTAQTVDFQRQVRPILSDNCFHCHGPTSRPRMFNLRLDTKEGAMAESCPATRKAAISISASRPLSRRG